MWISPGHEIKELEPHSLVAEAMGIPRSQLTLTLIVTRALLCASPHYHNPTPISSYTHQQSYQRGTVLQTMQIGHKEITECSQDQTLTK